MENSSTDGYVIKLVGYVRSLSRDFENSLRIVVGLVEDGFQIFLKQYNSFPITYELSPGIYAIKDIAEAVYTMGTLKRRNLKN